MATFQKRFEDDPPRAVVGRELERRALLDALRSPDPELVVVYGRRRVGKTFLIREVLRPCSTTPGSTKH